MFVVNDLERLQEYGFKPVGGNNRKGWATYKKVLGKMSAYQSRAVLQLIVNPYQGAHENEIDMTKPQPCTVKFRDADAFDWTAKLIEETDEAVHEARIVRNLTRANDEKLNQHLQLARKRLAEELTDVIHVTRYLDVADFKAGTINTKVRTYNEIPILSVPSARMKTAYVFNDGKSSGQEAGGFKADTGAKSINWILMARRAPIAISKTDKVRIFSPDTNQKADAWKLDYRKFHDIWIPSNKLAGVWVNTGA